MPIIASTKEMPNKAKAPMSSSGMDKLLIEYTNQLSDIEKIVLKIAQEHLETSFSLEKSIGFKSWYQSRNK